MSERIRSFVGKVSQETLMILAIGLTVLVSLFAGWNSLGGQIEGLRRAMNEGDARLRQERREDMAGLRGELGKLPTDLRGEMKQLRTELGGEMGQLRMDLRGEMGQLSTELRGEMKQLRMDLRGEMGQLRTELRGEIRAQGHRIDRLTESLIPIIVEIQRRQEAHGARSGGVEKKGLKDRNP